MHYKQNSYQLFGIFIRKKIIIVYIMFSYICQLSILHYMELILWLHQSQILHC